VDRERLPGFLAIAIIVGAVGAVATVLAKLGLVPLDALAQASFDTLLGGAAVAVCTILALMYPNSRIVQLFRSKSPTNAPLIQPSGLSEDKKHEILTSHWKDYAQRVLRPLRDYRPSVGQGGSVYRGDRDPLDELYVTYDPASKVKDPTDLKPGEDGFDAHLRNDIRGYNGDFEHLSMVAKAIVKDVEEWRPRLAIHVEEAIRGYAPIDRGGAGAAGAFVSLRASERRLVRAWKELVSSPNSVASGIQDTVMSWPPKDVLIPVQLAPGTADLWTCDQETLARPPAGKTIGDLQSLLAAAAGDLAMFREYASLKRRVLLLEESIDGLRARVGEVLTQIDRGGYRVRLKCCEKRIRPVSGSRVAEVSSDSTSDPRLHIEVYPLPHKKGQFIIPRERGRVQNSALLDEAATRQYFSNPERKEAAGSQAWDKLQLVSQNIPAEATWGYFRKPEYSFYMKFGVIRVHASGGTARDCEAVARFKTLRDPSGKSAIGQFLRMGNLNWYDDDIRTRFLRSHRLVRKLKENPDGGINPLRVIENRTRDIHDGEEADLQLFYTVEDNPGVYVCGGKVTRKAGSLVGPKTVKFQIEVSVLGSNFTKQMATFEATVVKDDFTVVKTSG
jgi:hypothetical protein